MSLDYPLTIDKLLVQTVHRGARGEIVYQKTRYNWVEFYSRIRRLGSGLAAMGVKKGSKVAMVDYDTNRYLEAYYAVPMLGAVLHTVNIRLPSGHIAYTMSHAEDDFVLLRDEFIPLAMKVASSARSIKGIVTMSDTGSAPSLPFMNVRFYDDILSSGDPGFEFPELDEDLPATMLYTSGTTGMPKGLVFTHRQIVLHTLAVQIALAGAGPEHKVDASDVLMPLVPFFHVHSWGMPYWAGLGGQKIVLAGKHDASRVLELISKEGVTFSHMIPTVLDMVLSHPRVEEYLYPLSKWKVVVGGDMFPRELALKARRLGVRVMAGYGLSETGPVLTLATPTDKLVALSEEDLLDRVLLKAGLPIPMVSLRIVDGKMVDVPRDDKTVGEVIARAPWLADGYYRDDAKTKTLWAGGWLHTGDMAVWDKDGYVTIVDRIRDAIRSGGEWIPSMLLEEVLVHHPAVSEVAVIGAKDSKWGERPVAIVALRRDQTASPQDLLDFAQKSVDEGKIAKFWLPDRFVILSEPLPKTNTGKVDKSPLRVRYSAAVVAS
ncbi:MAG TPA: long-chain-fatty-acid--CoA ligase [Nitrososphaerales archaeon]|nr:long-chain-fatty-acid--CoA ligase [Nitrososphaerales archaeon]